MQNLLDTIAEAEDSLAGLQRAQAAAHKAFVEGVAERQMRERRNFGQEFSAFLNSTFTIGEYFRRSGNRQFKKHEVEPLLRSGLFVFHRELRHALDHRDRPEFDETFHLSQTIAISYPLMSFARAEATLPKVGSRFFTHRDSTMDPQALKAFNMLKTEFGERPAVLFLAEKLLQLLREFAMRAIRDGRFAT